MLQVLACAPRAAVSCDERRRGEEHLLHGLSQRVSRSFQWGQRNDWQRGLLQHATNVGHVTFAALVHSPRSQHRCISQPASHSLHLTACISQPASNALCMYSSVYQADRLAVRNVGEVCFLACWVLVGRPHVLKKAQIGADKQADSDSHCTLLRVCICLHMHHLLFCVFFIVTAACNCSSRIKL
jgi:hypothetical protein